MKIYVSVTLKANYGVYQSYFITGKGKRITTPLFKRVQSGPGQCVITLTAPDEQGESTFIEGGTKKRMMALGVLYESASAYAVQQSANMKNLVLSGALSIVPSRDNEAVSRYLETCAQAKTFYREKKCCARGANGVIDYSKQTCCPTNGEPVCCRATGVTYDSQCSFAASGDTCKTIVRGECNAPCICHRIYRPVCVAGNRTFDNACMANCEVPGAAYTEGRCAKPVPTPAPTPNGCICIKIYLPVCDVATQTTYSNLCFAQCAGVMYHRDGSCGYGNREDGASSGVVLLRGTHDVAKLRALLKDYYSNTTSSDRPNFRSLNANDLERMESGNFATSTTPAPERFRHASYWRKEQPSAVLSVWRKNQKDADVQASLQSQTSQWGDATKLEALIAQQRGVRGAKAGHSSSGSYTTKERRGIVGRVNPTDERTEVSEQQVARTPWSQVGCISYQGSTDRNVRCSCSGTWVSQRHLLTAGHCLADKKAWLNVEHVYAAPYNGAVIDNGTVARFAWRRMTTVRGWFVDENREYDYGLIEVFKGRTPDEESRKVEEYYPGTRFGWRSFGYDNGIGANYWWNLAGYPADVRPPTSTDWRRVPWMRHAFNATYAGEDGVQGRLIYHVADTRGGQSGSGVYLYHKGTRVVYAVHRGWSGLKGDTAKATTYNVATRITPLRFAQICLWIADSGLRMC